jgi:putative transposase
VKKKVAVVSVADAEEAARLADRPLEATVALADVAGAIKDGLLAFASATGLVVMHQMMAAELTQIIGNKHAKIPAQERVGHWHGATRGSVVLGGRQVTTQRPPGPHDCGQRDRTRHLEGLQLGRPAQLAGRRAHAGRGGHQDVAEPVGEEIEAKAKSMSKSAVSRRFVRLLKLGGGVLVA